VLASLRSSAVFGVEACPVHVEVDVSFGLPVFAMVGLPDASVRESRDRVRSAIRNSGYEFPAHRITVNLAPADVRKAGASYDLPIALGILAAAGVIQRRQISDVILLGELSLDGSIQAIRGVLPIALAARREGATGILIPGANASEAAIVGNLQVFSVDSLADAVQALNSPAEALAASRRPAPRPAAQTPAALDLADVRGQGFAKRALEIVAAGGHNLLLIGPPGGGKTMMATRLPGVLPPLSFEEALDCTSIYSVAGLLPPGAELMATRPFRAPHHTISEAALVGGGTNPRPGEISLAHNGVLFLDELAEFDRSVLEVLRQPLEDGRVAIARSARTAVFPARFTLVAAMNPCPCGFRGDARRTCRCTAWQIQRYASRLSGPLLDRVDLVAEVPALPPPADGASGSGVVTSDDVRRRVVAARQRQRDRFDGQPFKLNAELDVRGVRSHCPLGGPAVRLFDSAIQRFALSARGCDRVLRVSRTIADLADSEHIGQEHVAEALQYRFIQ
jgi:magnesium chelatase family protein